VAFDLLLTHACVATMDGAQPFGLVRDGAVGEAKGKLAWIGRSAMCRQAAQARRGTSAARF
jgi:imidazolonepropionase